MINNTTKSIINVQNFIPSSLSTSYEQIEISIKSAPAQLQKLYRQKHSCDVLIKWVGYDIQAHKSVIDKSSMLMKQKPWPKTKDKWTIDFSNIKTKQKTPKQLTQKVISSIYGYCITIRRCEIQQCYQIAKQLQLQQILTVIHNDMLTHFQQYQMFPLMKMACNQQINEVVELCYDQLEIEMYQQLRYSKSGCFLLDQQLFKAILKRHNWQKMGNQKFGLSKHQVHRLVDEYCFVNGLVKENQQKIIDQIEDDKQTIKYQVSLNQVFSHQIQKNTTPRKVKSSSEIFFRNTLTLPREKEEFMKNTRRLSPFIKNTFNLHGDDDMKNNQQAVSPCVMLTPGQFSKSSNKSQQNTKSISNYSTDNRSQHNNRSRKQSAGSIETLSDPRILHTITQIAESQQQIKSVHVDIKSRTQMLMKKIKQQLTKSKFNTQKIKKMESNLEEIKAQVNSSKVKLNELTQTVNNVQQITHKKQVQNQFNSLFEKDVVLDLTLSRSFGMKERAKACKI